MPESCSEINWGAGPALEVNIAFSTEAGAASGLIALAASPHLVGPFMSTAEVDRAESETSDVNRLIEQTIDNLERRRRIVKTPPLSFIWSYWRLTDPGGVLSDLGVTLALLEEGWAVDRTIISLRLQGAQLHQLELSWPTYETPSTAGYRLFVLLLAIARDLFDAVPFEVAVIQPEVAYDHDLNWEESPYVALPSTIARAAGWTGRRETPWECILDMNAVRLYSEA